MKGRHFPNIDKSEDADELYVSLLTALARGFPLHPSPRRYKVCALKDQIKMSISFMS